MSQQPSDAREPRAIAAVARRADLIVKGTVVLALAWVVVRLLAHAI
ncbi:hypothetical protein KPL74_05005 [Bacillus sp. NP157]|nr:hypothetical protein KPL74_05005 [Bacillus sp. NP157]